VYLHCALLPAASAMVPWNHYYHSPLLVLALYLFLLTSGTLADEKAGFDCHISASGAEFDLTKLGGEHIVNRTRVSPPTKMVDSLRFDLCAELKPSDEIPKQDQCDSGTRACLTIVNQKTGDPDRILSIIPLAQASSTISSTASLSDEGYVSILFKGPEYPPNFSDPAPTEQLFNVTIHCNPDKTSDPKFVSYNGTLLSLEWSAPAGCPTKQDSEPPKDDKGGNDGGSSDERVGSGVGWFFLVILLAFAAYFGLGAYYNYTTYGARGMDLIPHRDFWQEVPYMLRDVMSHLCSSAHPRRPSRGGYVAV